MESEIVTIVDDEVTTTEEETETIEISLTDDNELELVDNVVIKGTSDYEKLSNLPSINSITLIGNITSDELNLQEKEDGKGLSTNDLTDELLEKINNAGDSSFTGNYDDLSGIPTVNGITFSGTMTNSTLESMNIATLTNIANTLTSANEYTDTTATSTLSSAKSYTDSIATTTLSSANSYSDTNLSTAKDYTDSQITEALSSITSITYTIVDSLPTTGEAGVIYLKSASSTGTSNIYEEYIYVNGAFECLGTTNEIDLSGYLQNSDATAITNTEIDTIFAT